SPPREASKERILRLVGEPMKRGQIIEVAKAAEIEVSEKTIERSLDFGIGVGLLRKGPKATYEPTALWLERFGKPNESGETQSGTVIPFPADEDGAESKEKVA